MVCNHPLMRHTMWYWLHDPNDPTPAPYELHFDIRKDALEVASNWITEPPINLRWIKIFRAHNEAYECYRWINPTPLPEPDLVEVEIKTKKTRWFIGHGEKGKHWWQLRK